MESTNRFSNAVGTIATGVEKVIHPASKAINYAGMAAISFVMMLVVVEVISRKAFSQPVLGAYELVEFGMVTMVVLAFAYTQMLKGHIDVELIVEKFPLRMQAILETFTNLICLGFWGVIAYQAFYHMADQQYKGITSANLLVPIWPFVLILAIGCVCFSIVIFSDVLRSLQKATAPKAYLLSLKEKSEETGVVAEGEAS